METEEGAAVAPVRFKRRSLKCKPKARARKREEDGAAEEEEFDTSRLHETLEDQKVPAPGACAGGLQPVTMSRR